MADAYLEGLKTEKANPATTGIDACATYEMLRLINEQDCTVPGAVQRELPSITQAVDMIYEGLKQGGRLIYVGAGTSGRLGVLDASECPPTYRTDPCMVQGFIAGGDAALRNAAEGAEDDGEAGRRLVRDLQLGEKDVLVGITASGSAAYVIAAAEEARARRAKTVALVTNKGSRLGAVCHVCIAPEVGPEVIMGSTRMKSGTAQKLVLNMLSTAVMVKLGKVYNNLMVDLRASNKKLLDRAVRIVCTATGATEQAAQEALQAADMHVKTAVLMLLGGMDAGAAREALARCQGRLKEALGTV